MTSSMRGWLVAGVIVVVTLIVREDIRGVVFWPVRFTLEVVGL